MKIEYLGTAAAEGVPALFCNCTYCRGLRARLAAGEKTKELRTRMQVLIDGELSVDFPPDAYAHMAARGTDFSAIKYLLVTHSHMDHFYAHDFVLRGYKYAAEMTAETLTIYGNREVCEVFGECTRREMKESVAKNVRTMSVGAFEEIAFGDWRAYPMPAHHSSRAPLLYLIERGGKRYLHLCDTGRIPEESMAFLKALGKRADVVSCDCTFLRHASDPNARHMNLAEAVNTRARLRRAGILDDETKFVITHFSHNSAPSEEALARAEREYGVIAAYDGLRLEV